ncbi:MAG: parC, partial [Massilia sp.]|nr:parC [Massilia sp.]
MSSQANLFDALSPPGDNPPPPPRDLAPPPPPPPGDDETLTLSTFAERAYLDYAVSVV